MNELDRWAHEFGYADFDTFIRVGGSRTEAYRDITKRIQNLQSALDALIMLTPSRALDKKNKLILPDVASETDDEPPDPDNAQIQGADHP